MTERLLQFIWQFRYFNAQELCVETGERLQILSTGELNTHQGPDFLQAEIIIGNTRWFGNIELHLRTSGWERHAHADDRNYDNVILHVVWEDDRSPGKLPLLVLQHRVPKLLLGKYGEWMKSGCFVPCEGQVRQTGEKVWSRWKEQLLIERLRRKTLFIEKDLQQNRQHWEQTAWWLLARNFGLPINAGVFGAIAHSLPLTLLSRHRDQPGQLEALLLGQAGLLDGEKGDEYMDFLQQEFHHLRGKYHLPRVYEPVLFMRMRPGNFPSVRLMQLAGLLQRSCSWFGAIREAASLQELMGLLNGNAGENDGEDGSAPGKRSVSKRKKLGRQMKENILINTFLPLLFAYGSIYKKEGYREKVVGWLQELGAEKNHRTAGWEKLGVSNRHAADSQSLLELKTRYCDHRHCLDCAIGKDLLKTETGWKTTR